MRHPVDLAFEGAAAVAYWESLVDLKQRRVTAEVEEQMVQVGVGSLVREEDTIQGEEHRKAYQGSLESHSVAPGLLEILAVRFLAALGSAVAVDTGCTAGTAGTVAAVESEEGEVRVAR